MEKNLQNRFSCLCWTNMYFCSLHVWLLAVDCQCKIKQVPILKVRKHLLPNDQQWNLHNWYNIVLAVSSVWYCYNPSYFCFNVIFNWTKSLVCVMYIHNKTKTSYKLNQNNNQIKLKPNQKQNWTQQSRQTIVLIIYFRETVWGFKVSQELLVWLRYRRWEKTLLPKTKNIEL